ncbi:unnamed protein product [Toxocara canis]|uniref:Protein UBASH3A-like protein n=1 Tax=Toxocara canis TaxID=6265 RepID=A0A183UTF1_TOXCA|nr:unnamed protein product [Toxocara canis]
MARLRTGLECGKDRAAAESHRQLDLPWQVHICSKEGRTRLDAKEIQSVRMAAAVESPTRRLLVVRHSERCDYHFKKKGMRSFVLLSLLSTGVKWINSAFDEGGRYRRFDAQMPATLAVRSGGPQDFNDDTPITTSGYSFCVRTGNHLQLTLSYSISLMLVRNQQCRVYLPTCEKEPSTLSLPCFSGELLRDRGIIADYVYSSPAYRCVQTSQGILEGELSLIFDCLGLGVKEVRIRIEPGLFQWMHWCKRGLPHFMSANEFSAAGFPVDVSYRAFDDATTFDEQETLLDYYNRSFALVQRILKLHPKGTILLVGHAGSLETLTRQLSGKKPRERAAFREFLHGTSYLAINEVIERNNKWKITGCPIPPLINSGLDRC